MLDEVVVISENALDCFLVIDDGDVDVGLASFSSVSLSDDDGGVRKELSEE